MAIEKDPTKLKIEELEKRVAPVLMNVDDPTAGTTTTSDPARTRIIVDPVHVDPGGGDGRVDVEQP